MISGMIEGNMQNIEKTTGKDLAHWLDGNNFLKEKLSQPKGAKLIGISRRALQKYLAGESLVPDVVGNALAAVEAGLKPYKA